MATQGMATTLSHLTAYDSVSDPTLIGKLTSIGEVAVTSNDIDVTTLDSAGSWHEYIQGTRDVSELVLAGIHLKTDAGQVLCRTLLGTGATGYFWITFPDGQVVAFTAYVKGYTAGPAEIDTAVMFGATLKVTGLVETISIVDAVAQSIANGATATMVSTATVTPGTATYQWYTSATNTNTGGTIVEGATSASYTTGALTDVGPAYYYCVVTVTGYRPVPSQVHVITVAAA